MKSWRDCLVPSVGYKVEFYHFPSCLVYWWRKFPFWMVVLHFFGHFGLDVYETSIRLLKLGLLYCEQDGGILTWQWRFWRSSPVARAIKEAK